MQLSLLLEIVQKVGSLMELFIVPRRQEHVLVFRRARGELVLSLRLLDVVYLVRAFLLPFFLDLLIELLVAGLAYL